MFVTVLLTAAQYNVVDYLPIPIRILCQKNNWVGLENGQFADVQYCIYADIVGGWVRKSPKYADLIYGWSLT